MGIDNFPKQKDVKRPVSEVTTSLAGALHLSARPINGQYLFPGTLLRSLGLVVREAIHNLIRGKARTALRVPRMLLRVNEKVCGFCVYARYISLLIFLSVLWGM